MFSSTRHKLCGSSKFLFNNLQRRAFGGKYEIPTLGEYNQLFNKSGIMDSLVPREIKVSDQLL